MKSIRKGLTSLLSILSLLSLSLSTYANEQSFEKEVVSYATFLVYQKEAIRIAKETDAENLLKKLDEHYQKMQSLIVKANDSSLRQFGTKITLKTMVALGSNYNDSNFYDLSKKLISFTFKKGCDDLITCSRLVNNLSDLVQINPDSIEKEIEVLKENSIKKLSGTLQKKYLNFQLDSLNMLIELYQESGVLIDVYNGKRPFTFSSSRELNHFNLRLNELQSFIEKEMNRSDETLSKELFKEISKEFGTLSEEEADLLLKFSSRYIGSLKGVYGLNQVVGLYADRMSVEGRRHIDLSLWLEDLTHKVEKGELEREIAISFLVMFAKKETYLPNRRDWLNSLERIVDNKELYKEQVQMVEMLVKSRENEIKAFLDQYGFSNSKNLAGIQYKDTLAERLKNNEKFIGKRYRDFHSLNYSFKRFSHYQGLLAKAATKFSEIQKRGDEEKTEKALDSFNNIYDQTLGQWLDLSCKAYYTKTISKKNHSVKIYKKRSRGAHRSNPKVKLSIPFASDEKVYELERACPKPYEYVKKIRLDEVWKPFKIELALTLATLPITLAAASVSGGASTVVSTMAVRGLTSALTRVAAKEILKRIALSTLPKIMGAVSGSIIFTAINRVAMMGLTTAMAEAGLLEEGMKWYDSDKSFWQNYGKELLYGSAIFYFLPITSGAAHKVSHKIGEKLALKASSNAQKALSLGITTLEGTIVFTAIPYLTVIIDNYTSDSDDPVWTGMKEFEHNLLHSLAITLIFKGAYGEARFGKRLFKKQETQTNKTIEKIESLNEIKE